MTQRAPGQANGGNSGLIDLQALVAAAEAAERASAKPAPTAERTAAPVVDDLVIYPFGPPPASSPAVLPQEPPAPAVAATRPASRKGLVILAAGGVALAGAVALMLFARTPSEPNNGETTPPAAQTALPVPTEVSPSANVPPAEPPAGAEPAPVTSVTAKPTGRISNKTVPTPKGSGSAKVKTPPPDPCKGDLLCAMKRSTEGR